MVADLSSSVQGEVRAVNDGSTSFMGRNIPQKIRTSSRNGSAKLLRQIPFPSAVESHCKFVAVVLPGVR